MKRNQEGFWIYKSNTAAVHTGNLDVVAGSPVCNKGAQRSGTILFHWSVKEVSKCLPSMYGALGLSSALHRPGLMVHAYSPSTWEMKAEDSEVQDHVQLQGQLGLHKHLSQNTDSKQQKSNVKQHEHVVLEAQMHAKHRFFQRCQADRAFFWMPPSI